MFDIGDIANRSAVLISNPFFLNTRCDRVNMVGNGYGELHAAAVICAGRLSKEVERGSYSAKDKQESS